MRTLMSLLVLMASNSVLAQTRPGGLEVSVTNTPQSGAADQADDTYVPGTEVTYTVTVANKGDARLTDISVRGALPQGIADAHWTCATTAGGKCSEAKGTGVLDSGVELAAGAIATYRVTLVVPADYAAKSASLAYSVSVAPGNLVATDTDSARLASIPPVPAASGASAGVAQGRAPSVPGRSVLGGRSLASPLAAAFANCGPDMFISQAKDASTNTSLYRVDTTVIPFELTLIGTGSVPYNALAYNPADNYLYAIRIETPNLIRIDSSGVVTGLGAVANLPDPPKGKSYIGGEIGTDGFMYVKLQDDDSNLYRINLTTQRANKITLRGGIVDGADLAWINGLLYSVNTSGRVVTVDPTTGQVTTLPAVNPPFGSNIGALFGTPDGFFGSRNAGGFYQFDIVTGAATLLSGSPVTGTNDGAHCASAKIVLETDLFVTKTNTPAQGPNDLPNDTYAPGSNVVYTIVVTNRGPVGIQNAEVRDPLPPGISAATWTCTPRSANAVCGAPSGTGALDDFVDLAAGESATYRVTLTVPANYAQTHAALTDTVTVIIPSGYVDPTPGDLTATDTDVASVDLRVTKTPSAASILVGDTMTYSIAAENVGTSDVVNAVLTDTIDARFDCPGVSTTAACTATGGAVCPAATVPVANLLGAGVTIPSLPAGSKATFTLTCRLTR